MLSKKNIVDHEMAHTELDIDSIKACLIKSIADVHIRVGALGCSRDVVPVMKMSDGGTVEFT